MSNQISSICGVMRVDGVDQEQMMHDTYLEFLDRDDHAAGRGLGQRLDRPAVQDSTSTAGASASAHVGSKAAAERLLQG